MKFLDDLLNNIKSPPFKSFDSESFGHAISFKQTGVEIRLQYHESKL